jgi:TolB protein
MVKSAFVSVPDLSWPAWSPSDAPDGAKITFDLVNGLGRNIYVMNAGGAGLARLTNDPARDTNPTWSP